MGVVVLPTVELIDLPEAVVLPPDAYVSFQGQVGPMKRILASRLPAVPVDVPGFNVHVRLGQSNGVGLGVALDPAIDISHPRIFQFPDTLDAPILATEPLISRAGATNPGKIGNALAADRALIVSVPENRSILQVNMSVSGTGFNDGGWCAPGLRPAELYIVARDGGTADHTITIDGHLITLKAGGAAGQQINTAADSAGLIASLRAYLVANVGALSYTTGAVQVINDLREDGSVDSYSLITLTQKVAGSAGNAKTCTQSGAFSFLVGGQRDHNFGCGSNADGGYLYREAVAQINQAMAYGTGVNRLAFIDWQGGEADINTRTARLESEIDLLLSALRANCTGASIRTPVLFGGMVIEQIELSDITQKADRAYKRSALRNLATLFVRGPRGSNSVALGEAIFHYDAATQRILGGRKAVALPYAARQMVSGAPGKFIFDAVPGTALGSINTSWTLPVTGSTRYNALELHYRKNGGAWQSVTPPAIALEWGLKALDLGAAYDLRLRGSNESGPGDWSDIVRVTTGAVPYLLDDLVLAPLSFWGNRKGRAAYAGACIRVRRGGDNAEMDIGWNANGLRDDVTLINFCLGGDGNGYVAKIYDHMGAHDQVPPAAINQPRIVTAGVLELNEGLPAFNFQDDAVNCIYTETAAGFPVAASFTMQSCWYNPTASGGSRHLMGPAAGGNHSMMLDNRLALFLGGGVIANDDVSLPPGTQSLGITYTKAGGAGGTARIFRSGAFRNVPGTSATDTTGAGLQLGSYLGIRALQMKGKMHYSMLLATPLTDVQMAAIGAADRLHWGAL